MGNEGSSNKKSDVETTQNLTQFLTIAKSKKHISRVDLEKIWCQQVDQKLCSCLFAVLFISEKLLDFDMYNEFAKVVLRGTYDDRAEFVHKIVAGNEMQDLKYFTDSLFASADLVEQKLDSRNYKSWCAKINSSKKSFERIVRYCCNEAGPQNEVKNIAKALSVMDQVWSQVFNALLVPDQPLSSLYPEWLHLAADVGKRLEECSILQLQDILFLNMQLLSENQLEWRLVYSTKIHGENFARLSGQIVNQGATLLVIEDKDSHIFGGFAPESWMLNPNYIGNSLSFLFSLQPTMSTFPSSCFNDNYQYLNQGQQTLPNGLGMGGRLEYFGLWLDSEFGKGICNDSCTTYRNFRRLSKEKEFKVGDVEVWAVGKPPPTAEELGERSILDGNVEAKAILQMAGRKIYSEGLRDAPKD